MGYDRDRFADRFNRKQKYRHKDKNDIDKVTKKRNSFYKKRIQEEEIEDLEEEFNTLKEDDLTEEE